MPLQGGYVAKQCPVRAQNDALRPAEPLPPSPVLERRFKQGRDFEDDVVSQLRQLHPDAVTIHGDDAPAREAATVAAMRDRAPLILEARLPADASGRRVGKPDLLLPAALDGYRAVDIKHHRTLNPIEPRDTAGLCSDPDRPRMEEAQIDAAYAARRHKGDLLQLAHYQRMLEAAGLAAGDGRHGGILGVERRIVWHDLDAPLWKTPSSTGKQKSRSTMEIYDFEFDFRLDIISVARKHAEDPSMDLLVVPVRISECEDCPWWDYCRPQLESGSGDVSLIPSLGWKQWKIHRDRGVFDRAGLAALDTRTARLATGGVDVPGLIALAAGAPADMPIADHPTMRKRPAQLERLKAENIVRFGDVARLSEATAAYSGAGMSSLPEQIDQARAALGPAPVYRRRGVQEIVVPRGDIEVDIDMENVEEGVYLWGTFLTNRVAASEHPRDDGGDRYRAFVTWQPLDPDVEKDNSLALWNWLTDLRNAAHRAGRTFRAYCYHAPTESTCLRRFGHAAGLIDQVEAFLASEDWVDMLKVFNTQFVTGSGRGLKMVAPLAGFAWEVEEPGGGESMLRYDVAANPEPSPARDEAREWLLSYNRGDVQATLAIRDWLDRESNTIPAIESLDP